MSKISILSLLALMPLWAFAQKSQKYNREDLSGPSKEFFEKNRDNLRNYLPDRSVAIFFSSADQVKSNDINHPFFQDPNFYYLTGFNEPNALLMVFKEPYVFENDTVNEIIFVPGRSKEYERWNGARMGRKGAEESLGLDKSLKNEEFADFAIDFLYFDKIFLSKADGFACDDPTNRGDLASMHKHLMLKLDTLTSRLDEKKMQTWMNYLREDKSEEEKALIQRAIDITCEAHKDLMRSIDTTYTEYKAESVIEHGFRFRGADGPGFPSIVGGGSNTCVLHYLDNNADLKDGDLLVVDVGAQYKQYSADVTRTIPVNGKFTEEQKIIYNLVLEAQQAGIEKCKPGNKFWDPNDAAVEVISKGLKDLGITKKSYQYRTYFMHGTSHYLGLDVHDAGSYEPLRTNRIITVEPGIYIPEGSDCDPKWWNIGVRIEDDILITNDKPVNLSDCVPRSVEEIEAIMQE